MEKKKYDVKIADVDMSIISDEREEFVQKLVSELDTKITEITLQSKRCSKLDAAILVALDCASDKAKAEKRVRNLEAQIALYDANLRRMRDDNIKLKSAMLEGKSIDGDELSKESDTMPSDSLNSDGEECDCDNEACEAQNLDNEDCAQLSIENEPCEEKSDDDVKIVRDEKIRQIADLFSKTRDGASNSGLNDDDPAKENKLRQIESLLRGKADN